MRMHSQRRRLIGATLAAIFGLSPFVGTAPIASAATDGTLDSTFNPDGVGADKAIRAVAFAADGKIYIGGDFTTYRGTAVNALARLNKDGTLDTTFNAGGAGFTKSGAQVLSLHVDADGDIYVAGNFAKNNSGDTGDYNTTPLTANVIRLNSDGTLDTSFTAHPMKYSTLSADESATVSLVKKIGDVVYISGTFNEVYETGLSNSATTTQGLLGLTTTGVLDPNFGAKVNLTDQQGSTPKRAVQIHAIPGSTDIYVVGNFTYVKTATEQSFPILANYVIRVATDGTRVTTYANKLGENVGANLEVTASTVTSDGKLILAGNFTTFNGSAAAGLVRVNADGTRDTTFTSPPAAFFSPNMTTDSNGRMYITGTLTNYSPSNKNIVRVKADGTVDADYSLDNQPNNYNSNTAISPDGEVYVYFFTDASQLAAGVIPKYGAAIVGFIARLNVTQPSTAGTGSSPITTVSAPGQPTDITVKVTGTKAKVSWKAPTTGAAPTSYTASALPTGPRASSVTSTKTLSCTATAPSTTCTISGLSAGMRYGFFVQSNGEGGTSAALFTSQQYLVTAAKTLPATGSTDTTLLMSVCAVALMAGGIGVRRLRRI